MAATLVSIIAADADVREAYALQAALVRQGVSATLGVDKHATATVLLCSTASRDDFELSQVLQSRPSGAIWITALAGEAEISADDLPCVLTARRDERGDLKATTPPPIDFKASKSAFNAGALAGELIARLGVRPSAARAGAYRRIAGMAAGVALFLGVAGAGSAWILLQGQAKLSAELRQANRFSDSMLLYMAERLPDEVRPDVLTDLGGQAVALFADAQSGWLSDEALTRRARILHFIGEARDINGDVEGAQEAFHLAHSLTGEHLARAPELEPRRFAHSQSAFWVGASAFRRGDLDDAREAFITYDRLVAGLASEFPDNLTYRAETGHAAVNTAAVDLEAGRHAEAAALLERALDRFSGDVLAQGAASTDDRANALAWLADARYALGDFSSAVAAREEEIDLRTGGRELEALSNFDAIRVAWANFSLARYLTVIAEESSAIEVVINGLEAIELAQDVVPTNRRARQIYILLTLARVNQLIRDDELVAAKLLVDSAEAELLRDVDGALDHRHLDQAMLAYSAARVAYYFQQFERAELEATRAVNALEDHWEAGFSGAYAVAAETHLLLYQIRGALGHRADAERALRAAEQAIQNAPVADWRTIDLRSRILWLRGEIEEAQFLQRQLTQKGYLQPDFIAFWRETDVAEGEAARVLGGTNNGG